MPVDSRDGRQSCDGLFRLAPANKPPERGNSLADTLEQLGPQLTEAKGSRDRNILVELFKDLWPYCLREMIASIQCWETAVDGDYNVHRRRWHLWRPRLENKCFCMCWASGFWTRDTAEQWAADRVYHLLNPRRPPFKDRDWSTPAEFLHAFRAECDLYVALNLASSGAKVLRRLAANCAFDFLEPELTVILKAWEKKLSIRTGSFGPALITYEWVCAKYRYVIYKPLIKGKPTRWHHAGALLQLYTNVIRWRLSSLLKSKRGEQRRFQGNFEVVDERAAVGVPQSAPDGLNHEQWAVVMGLAKLLPEPICAVFLWTHIWKLPPREVAREFELPIGAIGTLLKIAELALQALRRAAISLTETTNPSDDQTKKRLNRWTVLVSDFSKRAIQEARQNPPGNLAGAVEDCQRQLNQWVSPPPYDEATE